MSLPNYVGIAAQRWVWRLIIELFKASEVWMVLSQRMPTVGGQEAGAERK
jgi:hypothetical protein